MRFSEQRDLETKKYIENGKSPPLKIRRSSESEGKGIEKASLVMFPFGLMMKRNMSTSPIDSRRSKLSNCPIGMSPGKG